MKIYITFGQIHRHEIGGVVFDKDSIAELECESISHGRAIAMELFNRKFFTSYAAETLPKLLPYFPRGVIPVPSDLYPVLSNSQNSGHSK